MDRRFFSGLIRDWGIALLVTVGVIAIWAFVRGGPVTEGRVENVELQTLSGEVVELSTYYRGEDKIILNFWATWCGPCISELPLLSAFHDQHQEVTFLGISVDENKSIPALKSFAKRRKISYPVLLDHLQEVSRAYGVSNLPTTFILSSDGQIEHVRIGVVNQAWLEKSLE
jgi:peroxiredoxin